MKSLLAVSVLFVALAGISCQRISSAPAAAAVDASKYSAVVLSNGSVYFGKLEGFGTATPLLRDVFYVQSAVNQETKQVTNILVKRGSEWHGPDRMILNASAIVFVEPVGPHSKVAQLIAQAQN
jgi:hypothetical protein